MLSSNTQLKIDQQWQLLFNVIPENYKEPLHVESKEIEKKTIILFWNNILKLLMNLKRSRVL